MQIKKFVAPTLKEASQQMKSELGNEAIILSTRVIPANDELAIEKMFEITAGIESSYGVPSGASSEKNIKAKVNSNFQEELSKLSKKVYPANPLKKTSTLSKIKRKKSEEDSFERNDTSIEDEFKEIVDTLVMREIKKNIVSAVLSQLKKYENLLKPSNIDSYVLSSLASMIPTYHFEVQKSSRPKVVSLVGPTGVGKTTCIAKLAVISKILHNLDVGLISVDTYRLGALDQLRIFSEISNIDMLVAYEPWDIKGIMNSFKKKDIIFIDTAGRSQKNSEHLSKSLEFLDAAKVDETYLVLSATSTTKNLFDVAERFKIFDYNSVLFTKIDEAVAFGNILNLVSSFDIPISFFTNGQVIPDDIISADPEFTANMIYTGKLN